MATLFGKKKKGSKRQRDDSAFGQAAGLVEREDEEETAKLSLSLVEEKEDDGNDQNNSKNNNNISAVTAKDISLPSYAFSFSDLGLVDPLVQTCRTLGFKRPTPVQKVIIPFLLQERSSHVLALAATGSGKTAAFVLPIVQHLSLDPYGIYAVILTPTRELAKQIHQQVLALGSAFNVQSALVIGGLESVRQSCTLDNRPHFCVATPGRLAQLLRGPKPPRLRHIRYIVLDEADQLLVANSAFERDVAEILLHSTTTTATTTTTNATAILQQQQQQRRETCQTLLFSATMTRSLESVEEMAGAGQGRLPLKKFIIHDQESSLAAAAASSSKKDSTSKNKDEEVESDAGADLSSEEESEADEKQNAFTPHLPAGLKQEYIFMPSRVRDAYLLAAVRALMSNGGQPLNNKSSSRMLQSFKNKKKNNSLPYDIDEDDDEVDPELKKARSAIIFVESCQRCAFVSGLLEQVGVPNVALHSLLSQNRRLASLAKFKSQQVRILVATDVASRGLDIPSVDLVINSELSRYSVNYIHRVGRTARAGRRGRAVSLVAEKDISLVHAAERASGRSLEKCEDVTDDMAIQLLSSVAKAARLTKMKLMDLGFDELVDKMKERKARDRKERERIERALKRSVSGVTTAATTAASGTNDGTKKKKNKKRKQQNQE